jgi:LAGLIDADG endonuclease
LATVITNLLSAIPIFGQDIVELIYITNIYTYFDIPAAAQLQCSIFGNLLLPTVGTISPHALKKGKKTRLDKNEYLSIPYQFIAFLVGLIDGDGYIQIARTTRGFIAIKLVITLSLEDISTLEYIHSVLKMGKITIYKANAKNQATEYCKITINQTELQEVIFPLLLHHNIFFLTETRRDQFDKAMFIFKNDIKFYDQIPSRSSSAREITNGVACSYIATAVILTKFKLPLTAEDYIKLYFFKNWLVGFTNAEGSFLMKKNNDGCFQLKQRIHKDLFLAFKLFFNTNRNIYIEKDKFAQFAISSKADIQKVIDFFSFSGTHPLIGLKRIQYLKWLNNLQNSSRYKNLKFPQN